MGKVNILSGHHQPAYVQKDTEDRGPLVLLGGNKHSGNEHNNSYTSVSPFVSFMMFLRNGISWIFWSLHRNIGAYFTLHFIS